MVFSIIQNLVLNKRAFERFEKLGECSENLKEMRKIKDDKKRENKKMEIEKMLETLTIKEETFKLFKYMKSLEWLEKIITEIKKKEGGDKE